MTLRKGPAVAGVALVLLSVAVAAAVAADKRSRPPLDPRGEPSAGLRKGTTESYKVWQDDDGWHITVVNGRGSRDHKYQGTITVENGVMERVHSRLAKKNGVESVWRHGPKKHEVSFDFATDEKEDGINFHASKNATVIRLTLKIDGRDVPDQIYVGKRGDHPDSSTFELDAHPRDHREAKELKANKPGATKK